MVALGVPMGPRGPVLLRPAENTRTSGTAFRSS